MLSPRPHLIERIKRHEGLRLKPYICPTGHLTIGYGRNIEANGITEEEAEYLLAHDVQRAEKDAQSLEWFQGLSGPRQEVVVEMVYQMGLRTVRGFLRLAKAIRDGDWDEAANQMLASMWHKQTPQRCEELAAIMREGE